MSLVPAGFFSPTPIETDVFRLALLGPDYNESDYAAWTSSMASSATCRDGERRAGQNP